MRIKCWERPRRLGRCRLFQTGTTWSLPNLATREEHGGTGGTQFRSLSHAARYDRVRHGGTGGTPFRSLSHLARYDRVHSSSVIRKKGTNAMRRAAQKRVCTGAAAWDGVPKPQDNGAERRKRGCEESVTAPLASLPVRPYQIARASLPGRTNQPAYFLSGNRS